LGAGIRRFAAARSRLEKQARPFRLGS